MRIYYNRKNLNDVLVLFFLIVLLFVPMMQGDIFNKDILCIVSFFINGVISLMGIYLSIKKYSISMEMVYWIFIFFFMYFAPVLQYQNSNFPWSGNLQNDEILITNIVIFIFNLFFVIGKKIAQHLRIKELHKKSVHSFLCSVFEYSSRAKIVMTVLVLLLAVYSLLKTGFSGIIVSRDNAIQAFYSGDNSAIELIVESIVPAVMAYTVAEAAQSFVRKKENGIRFLLTFICLLVCFFPTTIPRYKVAVIYGTIFLLLFPSVEKENRFFWFFTLGLFIIFPLLSSARHSLSSSNFFSAFEKGFFYVYQKGDYDAYRMLASALRYVQKDGITWGYQLLGAIFFFLPRAVWHSKPIGSGATIIKNELGDNTFANVSCPFIAEGYINFGLIGVIAFGTWLGWFVCKSDIEYWKTIDKGFSFSIYLFLTFMLFFVLRGDLLSSFAYLLGFVVTGYLLRLVSKYI